jgi:hypothetical protein
MKFLNFTERSNNRLGKWSLIPICLVLIPFLFLLLTSCNGGGSSSSIAGGGIDGTGIMSAGVVTAIGSIEVNGTEFDTTNASVIVNGVEVGIGDEAVEDNLRIGMVVSVEGRTLRDGRIVADRVIYSANVVGPVTSVIPPDPIDPDVTERTIEVLGQNVVVNFVTKFNPDTYGFDKIALNDVVVVSGYRDFDESIRATFIERTGSFGSGSTVEVTGIVKNLNIGLETFEINDLTVNYAMIANELPEGLLAENAFIEVVGTLDTPGGVMTADEIWPGDESDRDDVDTFEIMGFVTEIIALGEIIKFKVGNQEVHADSDPDIVQYVDGEPGDIAEGKKLEAEGVFEGGILFADEVEFWKPDQIEVEGVVDTVDFVSGFPEFTFEEREDQLFITSEETEFEDIEKDEIEVGLPLEVKGIPQDIDQSEIFADKVSFEVE